MSRKQSIESLGSLRGPANDVSGIELEKGQLQLVKAVQMCEHEQIMEFVLFLTEFKRYLTGLTKPKYTPKVDEWLLLLSKYSRLFRLPQASIAYINMSRMTRRTTALVHGLDVAHDYYFSRMKALRDKKESEENGEE